MKVISKFKVGETGYCVVRTKAAAIVMTEEEYKNILKSKQSRS